LFKRKGEKEIEKRNRNKKKKIEKKEKRKSSPLGWAVSGLNLSLSLSLSLSRAPALSPPSRPKRPIARAPGLPSPLPLPARPHPSAALTLALSRSLYLWQAGPASQHLPRARDRASDGDPRRSPQPRRLAIYSLASLVGALRLYPLAPAEPSRHPLPELSRRRHCAPPSPSWQARRCSPPLAPFPAPGTYKRTTRAPSFSTPASATPSSLPRARLS
jgi:hypothetical protein